MEITKIKIDDINPAKYNPRIDLKPADPAYQMIKKSIETFGFVDPLVWNKRTGVLVGGHQRFKILKELGYTEIDCSVVDVDDGMEKAMNISLNKNSGEWDDDLLNELLKEIADIPDFDMEAVGFSEEEFEELLESVQPPSEITEDEPPEPPEEPITQRGDVWVLGEKHRLMCGDSTDSENVGELMGGTLATLCLTDPPYGMGKEVDGILNDNLYNDKLLEFNKRWIPNSFNFLTDVGSWYCWGIDEPLMDIYSTILKPMIKNTEATFRNLITWNKGNGQGQLAPAFRSYATADEKCLFVMKGVQGFDTNADNYWEGWEPIREYLHGERMKMGWDVPTMKSIVGHSDKSRDHWTSKSQWTFPTKEVYDKMREAAKGEAFKKEYDEIKKEYDEIKKEYYSTRAYFDNTHTNMNNVWHFDRTSQEERADTGGHATPKPIELCARAIRSSSREDGSVLDLFGGSGSTLMACEQTGRVNYSMELDAKYCDVIIQRYVNFTGNNQLMRNGEPYEWVGNTE